MIKDKLFCGLGASIITLTLIGSVVGGFVGLVWLLVHYPAVTTFVFISLMVLIIAIAAYIAIVQPIWEFFYEECMSRRRIKTMVKGNGGER